MARKATLLAAVITSWLLVAVAPASASIGQTAPDSMIQPGPCSSEAPPTASQHINTDGGCQNVEVGQGPCPANSPTGGQVEVVSYAYNLDTEQCLGEVMAAANGQVAQSKAIRIKQLPRTGNHTSIGLVTALTLLATGSTLVSLGRRRAARHLLIPS